MGGVDEAGAARRLAFGGGGDGPLQLPGHALRPEQAELPEGVHAGLKLLVGAELGGVLLHIGSDEGLHLVQHLSKVSTIEVLCKKLREILVVKLCVGLVGEDPGQHGPGLHRPAGDRVVDGVVHQGGGIILILEAAEGQVVVPGDHGQPTVLLVEVVVVDHGAGIAVEVADKVVDHEVADHLIHVHHLLNILPRVEPLQGGDEAVPVLVGDVGLGVVEDVLVAVVVVVGVDERDVVAAHGEAAHAASSAPAGKVLCEVLRRLPIPGQLQILRGREVPAGGVLRRLPVVHVKTAAIAPAAAHIYAVWLVELAVIAAVIPLQEGLLHPLHRQVQTPVLTVDGDVDIAAQGRGHAEPPHHLVGEVVLQIGVVLDDVVQAQLVQTMVGQAAVVVVKLDLEAVAVVAVVFHLGQGGVALGPDGHVGVGLPVDDHGAVGVLLAGAGLQESVPVVHNDVKGMDRSGVEEPVLVSHGRGGGLDAQTLPVHEDHRQEHRQGHGPAADPVDILVGGHGAPPRQFM